MIISADAVCKSDKTDTSRALNGRPGQSHPEVLMAWRYSLFKIKNFMCRQPPLTADNSRSPEVSDTQSSSNPE
jgi:hypothetical protein